MSYKPDYGLSLMKSGVLPSADQFFYDFPLYSVSVLGPGQYSTMVEMPLQGKLHALSLDFDHRQLEQVLMYAPPQFAALIRGALASDPSTPRTIDFAGKVVFGVRARLGQLQRVQREEFVPLIAQEIFSAANTGNI